MSLRFWITPVVVFAFVADAPAQRIAFVWPHPPVAPPRKLDDGQLIRLYPEGQVPHFSPEARPTNSDDVPTSQAFLPKPGAATGAIVMICPGGSYSHLSVVQSEPLAKWFAENGLTAFVLRYRRYANYRPDGPHYRWPVPLEDGERAIRLVRTHAKEWKLDPERIVLVGCSAGGHLASWLATHPAKGKTSSTDPIDASSTRIAAQVLLSPVTSMKADFSGTRGHFLTADQVKDAALIKSLSAESNVSAETPQAFLWHAANDTAVGIRDNSDAYAASLRRHDIPVEYLRTETGGHVKALNPLWSFPLRDWLRREKFASDDKK